MGRSISTKICSNFVLEFECHLDLQADCSNNVCSKWRMNIQTEQNKPHKKHMSIAHEFTVSFTIIKFSVTIVYIGKQFECIRYQFESIH